MMNAITVRRNKRRDGNDREIHMLVSASALRLVVLPHGARLVEEIQLPDGVSARTDVGGGGLIYFRDDIANKPLGSISIAHLRTARNLFARGVELQDVAQ